MINMRYFLVCYAGPIGRGHTFCYNTLGKFINLEFIAKNAKTPNAIITSVFEFRNEQDWLDAGGVYPDKIKEV